MTDKNQNSRLPIYLLLIGGLLLGAAGTYLYLNRPHPSGSSDIADSATQDASAAMSAAGMDTNDRKATEAIVRAYILEHPEIITEAIGVLQNRELSGRVDAAGPALTKAFAGDVAGNPQGDVTIVEFTDYNCGYCKAMVPEVEKLIRADKNIRLIYREVPILAQSSRDAALWALAAAQQGKHNAFHNAMFEIGHPDAETIRQAAQLAKLDIAAAQKFASSQAANAEIDANLAMMQKLGFSGTPTFIIGSEIMQGAQGYDTLKSAVGKARNKG
jgi:protein-disulfide isomerase